MGVSEAISIRPQFSCSLHKHAFALGRAVVHDNSLVMPYRGTRLWD